MTVEDHLLVCLAEECAEVGHQVCKALRFGLGDCNPVDGGTSAKRIATELAHVVAVARMLEEDDLIPPGWDDHLSDAAQDKKEAVLRWMKYAKDKGRLGDG